MKNIILVGKNSLLQLKSFKYKGESNVLPYFGMCEFLAHISHE